MRLEEQNNSGQFVRIVTINNIETEVEVLITKERFIKLKELHMNKYSSADFFWEMFERDLFDTEK